MFVDYYDATFGKTEHCDRRGKTINVSSVSFAYRPSFSSENKLAFCERKRADYRLGE
jgi:hypothetical protein